MEEWDCGDFVVGGIVDESARRGILGSLSQWLTQIISAPICRLIMLSNSIKTSALASILALIAGVSDGAPVAHPDADAILRKTSAALSGAKQFHFNSETDSHGAVLPGRVRAEKAKLEVTVMRPNHFVSKSTSAGDVRHFYFDGKTLTVFDATKHFYAVVPEKASIDGLLAMIESKYGFTPPLGELVVSNMYEDLRKKVQSVSYLGHGNLASGFLGLGGVDCYRVKLNGKHVDAELWVGVKDSLPRQLITTHKMIAGQPKLTVRLSDWDLSGPISPGAFEFHAPKGAMKIPMKTTAEIKALRPALLKKKN